MLTVFCGILISYCTDHALKEPNITKHNVTTIPTDIPCVNVTYTGGCKTQSLCYLETDCKSKSLYYASSSLPYSAPISNMHTYVQTYITQIYKFVKMTNCGVNHKCTKYIKYTILLQCKILQHFMCIYTVLWIIFTHKKIIYRVEELYIEVCS